MNKSTREAKAEAKIVIRLDGDLELKKRFKAFTARMGFKNYREALKFLLDKVEKELLEGRLY